MVEEALGLARCDKSARSRRRCRNRSPYAAAAPLRAATGQRHWVDQLRDPGGEGGGRWIKGPASGASALTDYAIRAARLTASYEGGIKERKLLSGGRMGETYEVTFEDGNKGILKIAKLNREFPMLTPELQTHHEVLAPQVGAAMRISTMPAAVRIAPDTVLKEYGEGTPAAEFDEDEMKQLADDNADDLRRLGFFDVLTHNGDRHNFNWLVQREPDGSRSIVPIDHGNLFGPVSRDEYREVTPMPEYSNPQMTDPFTRTGKVDRNGRPELEYLPDGMSVQELEDAEAALKTLRGAFDDADVTHQYKAMLQRLDKMLKDARYLEQRAKRKAAQG